MTSLDARPRNTRDEAADFLTELDRTIDELWDHIRAGEFWQHMREHGLSRDVYQKIMVELFHYTRHNSINQAFATWRVPPENIGLLRYCYEHASEELGHEKMVEHDLEAAGLGGADVFTRKPLPATQGLIGYLYFVGMTDGALARLGYSYWAENVYGQIRELLDHMRRDIGLSDRDMSFFVAHATIDEKHADEVREAVQRHVRTPEDQGKVLQVARTTLYLTGEILDCVYHSTIAPGASQDHVLGGRV